MQQVVGKKQLASRANKAQRALTVTLNTSHEIGPRLNSTVKSSNFYARSLTRANRREHSHELKIANCDDQLSACSMQSIRVAVMIYCDLLLSRAGFTTSGAPVQKKMWGPLIYEYPVTPPALRH